MGYKNGDYTAFYVDEPFNQSNLGAYATKDFCYYNTLKAWKAKDNDFPFIDSHNKNYNVRDGSDWERTLKPRLRERLRNSKNIILFLSSITKSSRALREEIDYGINKLGLPIIVVYSEYEEKSDIIDCEKKIFKNNIVRLWSNLPILRDSMDQVPTLHIPMKKELIKSALLNKDFMVQSKTENGKFFYEC